MICFRVISRYRIGLRYELECTGARCCLFDSACRFCEFLLLLALLSLFFALLYPLLLQSDLLSPGAAFCAVVLVIVATAVSVATGFKRWTLSMSKLITVAAPPAP